MSKFSSENDSILFYGRFIKGLVSSSDHPEPLYYEDFDTISLPYYYLDDTIYADTVFQNTNQYNGRITTYSHSYDEVSNTHYKSKFTVGCGKVYQEYDEMNPDASSYSEFELVYYKKGDEEWGEAQTIVSLYELKQGTEVKIFPNPTSDYINISTKDNSDIQIFNSTGQLLLSQKANSYNTKLDISIFPAGVYFVNLMDKDGLIIGKSKFIKL